jgi:Skp family chaperone for outer membrane proteins
MMLRRLFPFAALALAGGMLLNTPAARADGALDLPVKIAIADPGKIFQNIAETKDILAKIEADGKQLASVNKDKQDKINAMKQALTILDPKSPQYADQNEQLLKASIEYEVWARQTDAELQRKRKVQIKGLFDEITEAIAKVAKDKNINLVITDQRPEIPDDLNTIDLKTLQALISQRTVLYSDQSRDISSDVITLLDKQWNDKLAAQPK